MQDAPGGALPADPAAYGPGGRALVALTRYAAIFGGLVFVALVAMEIVSIVGRKLFAWSVPGDVELLQMGAAFASASFFAHCHLGGGDVKVDFFTQRMAPGKVAAMDAFGSLLVALFGALLAWRTAALALATREVGETSAILAFPVWIAQALMVPGFALLAAAGLYVAVRRVRFAVRAAGGGTAR